MSKLPGSPPEPEAHHHLEMCTFPAIASKPFAFLPIPSGEAARLDAHVADPASVTFVAPIRGRQGEAMPKEEVQTVIFDQYVDVAPFVAEAIEASNGERHALGFLPAQLFTEQARKGNLFIVASVGSGGHLSYAGHLLFDARRSRASVLQVYTKPDSRHSGIARRLLDHLKQHLTELGAISIYAKVAEDLKGANDFWQRNGFYVQSTRPGGKTRNRTILIRCHELSSPQLFERSGITAKNPFGLDTSQQDDRPIYLLDLNVLFDLGPRRPRHEAALDLFHAERHGFCQLALSAELQDELARHTAAAAKTDPMQAWAAVFITFSVPPADEKERLIDELGATVFPRREHGGKLTANERSDLTHLATAIHHRLSGFVTSDESILAASKQLELMYGIYVVSPASFQPPDTLINREELFETSTSGQALTATPLPVANEGELRSMLKGLGIKDSDVVSVWGCVDSSERAVQRLAVMADQGIAGYLACSRQTDAKTVVGRLAIDESHSEARGAARLLLNRLISKACERAPAHVRVQLAPNQVIAREVATALGFAGSDDGSVLSKLVLNRVVTPSNWKQAVADLRSLVQLRLPPDCPPYKSIDQQVEVLCPDGNRRFVRLQEVETSLSPALFCLPGRNAVITPIQSDFAQRLLEHSPQKSLLPHSRAAQYAERHYLSDKKTLKRFTRGTIILFYESGKRGGSSAIVAVARVQRAYLKPNKAIEQVDFDPSVLSADTLSTIGHSALKTVTAFDNVIVLPRPVSLSHLQQFGCGKPTDLITTRAISSDQLAKILEEAFSS